jgi:Flp pilus assembly protein TadG
MMISLHNIFTLLGQRFRSDSSGVYFVYFVLFPMLCYAYFAYFVCRSCWKVPVSLFLA